MEFLEFDTRDVGSLSEIVKGIPSRTGIYWLRFDDGMEYIGQTVDFGKRLATHRRHQRGRIVSVGLCCAPAEELDSLERRAIWNRERELRASNSATGLRNKLIVEVPGGPRGFEYSFVPGTVIPLPMERESRGLLPEGWRTMDGPRPTPHQAAQWAKLRAMEDWPRVREFLRAYTRATLSSPHLTAGRLWTISALPNTSPLPGWRRLCTLNTGRMESVYIGRDAEEGAVVCWNIAVPHGSERRRLGRDLERFERREQVLVDKKPPYARPVWHLKVYGVDVACRLLRMDQVADLSYRLNTINQREGMRVQSRWHNPLLAEDLLGRGTHAPEGS